jgi:hypothetical protein
MKLKGIFVSFFIIAAAAMNSFAAEKSSIFVVTPLAGWIESDVSFPVSPGMQGTIKDNGPVQGLNMIFVNDSCAIGSLFHISSLGKSRESGYLFYTNYYFMKENTLQPMAGFYLEHISVNTALNSSDVPPFDSMNVNSDIIALNPVIGLSYHEKNFRLTPFIGYFNEQVDTAMTTPGMRIGPGLRNGFSAEASEALDYAQAGLKFEGGLAHFMRFDIKAYYRFAQGSQPLFTTRNRLDCFLTKTVGFCVKVDYFQDTVENNYFIFLGPSIAL